MKICRPCICICHYCGCNLTYKPFHDNIYNGGPWYCGNCGANVTEDIYGKNDKGKSLTKDTVK